jgi:hypothetical protein
MRLQNFLITEGERTQEISQDEAMKKLLTTHRIAAKASEKKDGRIYRGMNTNHGDFSFVQPSQFTRKSKNTLNAYTLLIDNLPAWKAYPKRSKSIIASSDYSRATDYGNGGGIYCVFPENGAKIGVCPTADIWNSFSRSMAVDMHTFNHSLRNLIMLAYNTKDLYVEEFKEWNRFLESLDHVDKMRFDIHDDYVLPGTIQDLNLSVSDYLKKGSKLKLIDHLAKILDPTGNRFELKKVGDDLPQFKEVWTDGDCVLIKHRYFMDNLIGKL